MMPAEKPENNELAWANFYASRGWSVVPVHRVTKRNGQLACSCARGVDCISKGKHPALPEWKQYQTRCATKDELAAWWEGPYRRYGVGLITGSVSGVFIVDVDEGQGKDGGETLHRLQMEHDDLPETVTAKTGGGGRHFLFQNPPGLHIPTAKNTLGPGIDTRGEGGFVVAAPSLHASGQHYIWDEKKHPQNFPVAEAPEWLVTLAQESQRADTPHGTDVVRDGLDQVEDGRETFMMECIARAIIAHIRNHGALPTEAQAFDAAWPAYARDAKTRDPLKTLEQEQRGETLMRQRIRHSLGRARSGKWDILERMTEERAERAPAASEAPAQPLIATPLGTLDIGSIPRRQFLYGRHLIRGYVSTTVSPGGAGKTTIALTDAIAIATARKLIADAPHEPATAVWHYNLEDPRDELLRRVAAICVQFDVDPADIADRLFLDSGRDRKLIVADRTREDTVIATPDVQALEDAIRAHGISVLSVDPFVKVHYANENDNKQIDDVLNIFAGIAQRTNCAIDLVHHVRKPPTGGDSGHGDINAARGASSLAGAVRAARTVATMSQKDAEAFGIAPHEAGWYVRVDDAKGNMSPPAIRATWLKRESVTLDNGDMDGPGDNVGVLVPWSPPDAFDGMNNEVVARVLRAIEAGLGDGQLYTFSAQSKGRWAGNAIMDDAFDKSEADAKTILLAWRKSGLLFEDDYDDPKQRKQRKGVFVDWSKQPGTEAGNVP